MIKTCVSQAGSLRGHARAFVRSGTDSASAFSPGSERCRQHVRGPDEAWLLLLCKLSRTKKFIATFLPLVTFMVCTCDVGLADRNKVKTERVSTVSPEIKPAGTAVTCYLNCDGLIC